MFTSINTFVINMSITSSSRPIVVALDEDNKKVSEDLQRVDLPLVPLSPYNFVH